ncbi:MAG: hypothetical protein ACI398_08455 [Clostridium sp.]
MYLSKPEEGFSIPVVYVSINELNIDELKDINTIKADRKINYLKKDKEFKDYNYDDIYHIDDKRGYGIDDEKECKVEEKVKNRLLFDTDEGEIDESIINRENNEETETESGGLLILDGDSE